MRMHADLCTGMNLRTTARNNVIPAVTPPPARDTPRAPAGVPTQPKPGALAFVPFEPPAGSEKLLSGFRAVAQKQGPMAAVQWLTKNSGALQPLVKTPMGRAALAGATLGFSAGWAAAANAPKVQALTTALQAVADQRLPADQTARQVGQVLQAALAGGQDATPTQGKRSQTNGPFSGSASKQPDSLAQAQAKLVGAKRVLAESQAVLKQNPLNPGQREIVQAKQADAATLQGRVNVLTRAQGASAKLPGAGSGKTAGPPRIEKPPSPSLPKEVDHSREGFQKALTSAGHVMIEQRLNAYRSGRITRAEAKKGLSGDELQRTNAQLDAIDRSRLPPGGVTGGRKSTTSNEGESPSSAATSTKAKADPASQPTHENMDRLKELLADDAKMAEHFDAHAFGKNPGSAPTSYLFGGHAASGPFADLKAGNAYGLRAQVDIRVDEMMKNGTLQRLSDGTKDNDVYIHVPTGQLVRVGKVDSEELSATVSYSNLRGRGKGAQLDLDQSLFMPEKKVFDANRSIGFGVLVMERVPGESLASIHEAKIKPDDLKSVAGKVADAVVDMHMNRRIHGDLHKGNIMFDKETGQVRVIDFGYSRRTTDPKQREDDVHGLASLILDGYGHNTGKGILAQATNLYLRALDRYSGPDRNAPVYKNHPELYEPHLKRFNERKAALRSEMAQ
jgi:Protein kinase domain